MFESLKQMAAAVGASTRWVLNAFRVLGVEGGYTVDNAKRLSFARALKTACGLPLTRGWALADEALGRWPEERTWTLAGPDGTVLVTVDLERFLSDFGVRLSLARCWVAEKARGRPLKHRKRGVAWAEEYGEDISLLKESLKLTPAERLRRADEALQFARRMRVVEP